jgi:Zn-dependent M28 family amino/carboxypeptidase
VNSRQEEFALSFPQVILEQSAYLKLWSEPQSKVSVVVESQFLSNAPTFNTFGEIPGTTNQKVMIGAHLDSIPYGEGAVDNGGNVATVMEAMRILKTLGVQPKHSIVSAFWTGEEQHLLGSRAYVREHKQDLGNLRWYFNLDFGIGKIRGINTLGHPNVPLSTLEAWLKPFKPENNAWLLQQRQGEGISDDASFHEAGIRSLEFVQDPTGYEQAAHSSGDTFSLLSKENMRYNAAYVARVIWQAANE